MAFDFVEQNLLQIVLSIYVHVCGAKHWDMNNVCVVASPQRKVTSYSPARSQLLMAAQSGWGLRWPLSGHVGILTHLILCR